MILIGEVVTEKLLKRIVSDPQVMAGKPVIRGTSITVDYDTRASCFRYEAEEIAEDYGLRSQGY